MLFIAYILCFIILVLMLPVAIFLLQVVAASFAKNNQAQLVQSRNRPSAAILMPAHNEASVIEQSIKSIMPLLQPQDSLIVVADNCDDDTAAIARECGATVIERFNQQARGKGYALDYGLQYLKKDPFDVVVIIDADCMVHENAINLLITSCVRLARPIQGFSLMEPLPNPSLKARIASFAWHVKNKVRPLGLKVMGLPCQLMGTGMAFRWVDINKVSLASGHIVEDMKLGTDFARINKAPVFLLEAVITSVFPTSEAGATEQRTRWEHGHLSVILSEVPKLMIGAIKRKNLQMFGLACDLLIPPLAMLTLMCLIVFVVSLIFGNQLIILLSLGLLGCLLLAILLAWYKFGQAIISFKQLCYAPIYALVKIPLYIKFFLNRQVEWVRSKRD